MGGFYYGDLSGLKTTLTSFEDAAKEITYVINCIEQMDIEGTEIKRKVSIWKNKHGLNDEDLFELIDILCEEI